MTVRLIEKLIERRLDLYSTRVPGTSFANTAAESVLLTRLIPARYFEPGSLLQFTASIVLGIQAAQTHTFIARCRLGGVGGTLLFSSGTYDPADTETVLLLNADVIVHGSGATTVFNSIAKFETALTGVPLAPTTSRVDRIVSVIDTTIDLNLVITGQWSTANGANTMQAQFGSVNVFRPSRKVVRTLV